jgi:hypothetical protein
MGSGGHVVRSECPVQVRATVHGLHAVTLWLD